MRVANARIERTPITVRLLSELQDALRSRPQSARRVPRSDLQVARAPLQIRRECVPFARELRSVPRCARPAAPLRARSARLGALFPAPRKLPRAPFSKHPRRIEPVLLRTPAPPPLL